MGTPKYLPNPSYPVNLTKLVTLMDISELQTMSLEIPPTPRYLPYKFETLLDPAAFCNFAGNNWYLPFIVSAVYIVTIFGLKAYMTKRKPFDLRRELFLWNAFLGIFSIVGFARIFPGLFSVLRSDNGFYNSICLPIGLSIPEMFWTGLAVCSKYVELGDTIFIVLRKKPLVFLQWYHHSMALIFCWVFTPFVEPFMRYCCCMNLAVHSLMYPYFSLKALGVDIPRRISSFITTCQLSQMLFALFLNCYTTYLFYTGTPCRRFGSNILYSAILYGSFAILFGKLFIDMISKTKKIQNKSD